MTSQNLQDPGRHLPSFFPEEPKWKSVQPLGTVCDFYFQLLVCKIVTIYNREQFLCIRRKVFTKLFFYFTGTYTSQTLHSLISPLSRDPQGRRGPITLTYLLPGGGEDRLHSLIPPLWLVKVSPGAERTDCTHLSPLWLVKEGIPRDEETERNRRSNKGRDAEVNCTVQDTDLSDRSHREGATIVFF